MEGVEEVHGYASDISNNKPEIFERSGKTTTSLDISSKMPDNLNLLCNEQDSADYSSNIPDDIDLSSIRSDISVSYSEKTDSIDIIHDCTDILLLNDKADNPDKLNNMQNIKVFSPKKCSTYVNSSNKTEEPEVSNECTGICVFSSDSPVSYFSTGKPGSCDFSCEKPWNENFPSRKSRSSDLFSEHIWGSNFSSDNSVRCSLPSDKSLSSDFSSETTWGGDDFWTDNPEACDFSGDKPWIADFSSDKSGISDLTSVIPISIDHLNKTPDDSKHSNCSPKNPYTTNAMLQTSNKVAVSSFLLYGKSCSVNTENEESVSSNKCSAHFEFAEASNICSENRKKSSKSFDSTENLVIKTSVIPSYRIETRGILGNDPRNCKTENEINDFHNFSFNYSECLDYGSLESFDNVSEVTIADGLWKIEKCHQSSKVCVLKRLDEDTQYQFKCIYFNKGTKLDELFKNRSHDDLNVSQEELLECIDSMKEDQLNFIEDPIKSNDRSGFLEDRMGTSVELTNEDFDGENIILIKNTTKEQIEFVVDKLLNEVFSTVDKNEQNFNLTRLKTHDEVMLENARYNEVESQEIYKEIIYSDELDNFGNSNTCEVIGSQVQDLSGYLSSTDPLNDSVTETTNPRNQLFKLPFQQTFSNWIKIVWESVFSVMLGVFSSFYNKTKCVTSTECATTQTVCESFTDYEELQSETDATNGAPTSCTNTKTVPSESIKTKTRIASFSTLFQHLSATAGTDMTAERAMKDINSQVVMDVYNGFHELRSADYGSLDLMSKCIRGCIVTLQRTLTQSNPIIQKASVLLRKKTNALEEMRDLNEDLKDLTSHAEVHLHNIDRALAGLEDFTDDFMYYKNTISKELVEFLLEDFPEILK